jgi:hypothetical protein
MEIIIAGVLLKDFTTVHFSFAELWQLQDSLADFSQFAKLGENVAELWCFPTRAARPPGKVTPAQV